MPFAHLFPGGVMDTTLETAAERTMRTHSKRACRVLVLVSFFITFERPQGRKNRPHHRGMR